MRLPLDFLCGVTASCCWLGLLQSCSPEYALLSSDEPAPVTGSAGSGPVLALGGFSPATAPGSGGLGVGGEEPVVQGGESAVGGDQADGGAAP